MSINVLSTCVSGRVRLSGGIEIDLATGERVVADGRTLDGDINLLSHAHGDHLYDSRPDHVVCSSLTAALANERRDPDDAITAATHPRVELFESGHIAGSTAARIDGEDRTYLYTGDLSIRDRFFLSGFDPVPADVLIMESTYGKPDYVFPDQMSVEKRFVDWLDDSIGQPVVVFAYSLGRAQEVLLLTNRSEREGSITTEGIRNLNAIIESFCDVTFDTDLFISDRHLGPDDVLVLPSQVRGLNWVETLVERTDALTAGLSGWAINPGYKYRGGYDETFPLSDHCDFEELKTVVEGVDPDIVYTQHGFADELANAIVSDLGYDSQALKQNQTTLEDF